MDHGDRIEPHRVYWLDKGPDEKVETDLPEEFPDLQASLRRSGEGHQGFERFSSFPALRPIPFKAFAASTTGQSAGMFAVAILRLSPYRPAIGKQSDTERLPE